MLATEVIGAGHSFAVSISAHTGIGTLPLLYYGNELQKNKYLKKLVTGEIKACYCLTEPGSGSDANSGKTKATLSDDGKHYIINGQKMWITNGGFADLFTVFAKIDSDENLSAFLVEKDFGGITLNPEEHKMGIKGSSTRQVFFTNCKVPVENLLSERQNGFKIAVNILNIGRIKLAAAALGAAKYTATKSIQYANERVQFGHPIAHYGAIQYKLAEQAIQIFASESALYRTTQNIEDSIASFIQSGFEHSKALLKGVEQFAPEAAILKVNASETLDYVVDEGLQIYGGMGYSSDAPMERAYRDSRINRIFEGTNEINRLLIVDMLLKRALKGDLDLMGPASKVASELLSIPTFTSDEISLFATEKGYISNFKKAILMIAGSAVQKFGSKIGNEQEIIINISNMIIDLYLAESIQLRLEKINELFGLETNNSKLDIMQVFLSDAADRIYKNGKDAVNAFAEGDELRMMLMGLKRFTKTNQLNSKEARRRITAKLTQENQYCF